MFPKKRFKFDKLFFWGPLGAIALILLGVFDPTKITPDGLGCLSLAVGFVVAALAWVTTGD